MKEGTIHIYEEHPHFLWGLAIVVAMATGTYLLVDAFISSGWTLAGFRQIVSLLFFIISFYGIVKLSSPLFHFILTIDGDNLIIDSYKGKDTHVASKLIELATIAELRIAPHAPRAANEALFDFSASFHLLYRQTGGENYHKLIHVENETFTLKVEDIRTIIRFLQQHHTSLKIPEEQELYLH